MADVDQNDVDKIGNAVLREAERMAARFGMSPIEANLFASFSFRSLSDMCEMPKERLSTVHEHEIQELEAAGCDYRKWHMLFHCWRAFPQHNIGRYRADFAFVGGAGRIVVECDGHDYHERTKEQARHDKRRDRFFQLNGWRVLRFTGSEIHADPDACADQVYEMMNVLDLECVDRMGALLNAKRGG